MIITKEQKEFLKLFVECNNSYNINQKEILKATIDSSLTIEELAQKTMLIMMF